MSAYKELVDAGSMTEYLELLTSGRLTSGFAQNIANVPENPAFRPGGDDTFRVFVPLTGGMDSTTLWQMALESGLTAVPVYLNFGQPYAEQEMTVAWELAGRTGHTLVVFPVDLPFKRFDYIMLARNAAVIFTVAEHARKWGLWGELWFGNMGDESPVLGGDKSRRFFGTIQALLYKAGYDMRVCNLLMGLDKVDEVTYWKQRDLSVLRGSKSCFSANAHACGACQSCFRKWVAFLAHGIDIREDFTSPDIRVSFAHAVERYTRVMGAADAANDFTLYTPARIRSTLDAIRVLESS